MSLAGRGVLVTRPATLAGELVRRIEAAGGRPFVFPALAIEPLERPAVLDRLADFALAIFVSPTAVARAFASAASWPATVRVAAVGESTRRALERAGFRNVIAPGQGGDSEALLALPELAAFAGKRVLIVRGVGGRDVLLRSLAEQGCEVAVAECYRRVLPDADTGPLLAAWAEGKVHAVTLFSGEALDNLVALLGEPRLRATPVFASHSRIVERARRLGLDAILAGPSDHAMVERLVAYFHD